MTYGICIRLSGDNKTHVESFYNDIRKRADKGQVEFGVNISVERITDPKEIEND